jgi:hypothetical protein
MNMFYPSIPFYYRPNILLVPNSIEKSISLNQEYIQIVQTTIDQVIDVFMAQRLPVKPFKIVTKRDSKSGITGKAGFYLIFNLKNKNVYLGETINLATRKATYMQGMREATKVSAEKAQEGGYALSLDKQLRKFTIVKQVQLKISDIEDFIFVPVVISDNSQFRYLATNEKAKRKDIDRFLLEIETMVLKRLINRGLNLYNQKFGGLFEKKNKFGGSPNSGTPSLHIKIGNVAFESVSCAAQSLGVTRKTIRNYITKYASVDYLTEEQWTNWTGEKVFNSQEAAFLEKNPNFRAPYYGKSKKSKL